jgi:hypothetical protein
VVEDPALRVRRLRQSAALEVWCDREGDVGLVDSAAEARGEDTRLLIPSSRPVRGSGGNIVVGCLTVRKPADKLGEEVVGETPLRRGVTACTT